MADYLAILQRAIYALPDKKPENRRSVYERARVALVNQLKTFNPPLSSSEITQQRLQLEDAIRRVESEVSGRPVGWRSKGTEKVPTRDAVPAQDALSGVSFTLAAGGRIDIEEDRFANRNLEQAKIYARVRSQFASLRDQVPSQEYDQVRDIIDDFLSHPEQLEDVKFKKLLWLSGNDIRCKLEMHEVALRSDDYSRTLPAVLVEQLKRPLQTWNVFVLADPDLAILDSIRAGPKDRTEAHAALKLATEAVLAALATGHLMTPRAADIVERALASVEPEGTGINAVQKELVASKTVTNLIVRFILGAYDVVYRLRDPGSEEAKNFVKEYKSGIFKKMGEITAVSAVTGAAAVAYYSIPMFEFVTSHSRFFQDYATMVLSSNQIVEIINIAVRIKSSLALLDNNQQDKK